VLAHLVREVPRDALGDERLDVPRGSRAWERAAATNVETVLALMLSDVAISRWLRTARELLPEDLS
jgi:hypothetical protein